MDTSRCFPWVKSQKPRPYNFNTDDVLPVHSSDDRSLYRKVLLSWTLHFDDVLDTEMLQNSLSLLLKTSNWRKLGGRLRQTADGKLVLHIPKEFTPERPAVRFSHQSFGTSIDQHPLARQLPRATENRPSKHLGPKTFRLFSARPDAPTKLQDLLRGDEPQLSVHITSFSDATLVGLRWPHTMTGAIGLSALMNAWSLALAGRWSEVPQLQGVHEDLLDEADARFDPDQEPYSLAQAQLKGLKLLRFGLRFFFRTCFRRKKELGMLYLPASFVSKLRQEAFNDLKSSSSEPVFVSDGDVLCSWATRMMARQQGKQRPVLVLNIFDIQSRLKSIFRPEHAYVQNTAFGSLSIFRSGEVSSTSFGKTAFRIREDLIQQSTEEQILAQLHLSRDAEKLGHPLIFGEPKSLLLMISNWTKANFFEVIDFSPAIVEGKGITKAGSLRQGKIVYHHSEALAQSPMATNVFVILGKDQEGNYWVASSLSPDSLIDVEDAAKRE
ncbi:uncharacterized protein NECHADRAFT_86526 [Fusarium vanettenii 77-13-4]|uniref:Uncharacterized protein n=1 Tax=Fusarium vanettenii (strain ATCC MYA-4622 / CBS 123669 / FGSC 9596 / NRRL 45880 / 77-13-4) TaxID=660122 RepID=C7ZH90_FUSV7|nr:uncharacterized protein NECHADRAFT_86526 [Fusarium vanettenii 77-13-4]EEU36709.1 hypothetical protein NECHADRAFT_86526 [Fusarium vanettenii 77-13-4]